MYNKNLNTTFIVASNDGQQQSSRERQHYFKFSYYANAFY